MAHYTQHDGSHEGCDLDVAHEHNTETGQASIPMGAANRLFFGGVAVGDLIEAELKRKDPHASVSCRV